MRRLFAWKQLPVVTDVLHTIHQLSIFKGRSLCDIATDKRGSDSSVTNLSMERLGGQSIAHEWIPVAHLVKQKRWPQLPRHVANFRFWPARIFRHSNITKNGQCHLDQSKLKNLYNLKNNRFLLIFLRYSYEIKF